jgi:hypothetical protein
MEKQQRQQNALEMWERGETESRRKEGKGRRIFTSGNLSNIFKAFYQALTKKEDKNKSLQVCRNRWRCLEGGLRFTCMYFRRRRDNIGENRNHKKSSLLSPNAKGKKVLKKRGRNAEKH